MLRMTAAGSPQHLSPAEYGRQLAAKAPRITTEQGNATARILSTVTEENAHERHGRGADPKR